MTRADAEAEVRLIGRHCRGPLPQEIRNQIAVLFREGKQEEAVVLDAASRNGCGADINDVICAGPFDGEEYAYECKCGVIGSYTAPYFTPETETAA